MCQKMQKGLNFSFLFIKFYKKMSRLKVILKQVTILIILFISR
jgi:hypothetical protein